MRVKSDIIESMHLDPGYALLSVQNVVTCMELFRMMDLHHHSTLNDIQFWVFIRAFTDLSKYDADLLFHLLDVDHSGEMDFEEFYLVFCVLVASKDQYEKEFIYRHSNSIFRLIDSDASGLVSNDEFSQMGILFNFDSYSISAIFDEFDISGDKNLDFGEFRLFTMACIDEQRAVDANAKVAAYKNYHQRLLISLQDVLRQYIRTKILPKPAVIEFLVDRVRPPFIPRNKRWRRWLDFEYFGEVMHRVWRKVQKWMKKVVSYFKFLGQFIKKVLIRCKCNVCFRRCCSCCIRKPKRKGKKRADRENYRLYNRRKRAQAKRRNLFKKKNKNFDEGKEYIEPSADSDAHQAMTDDQKTLHEQGLGTQAAAGTGIDRKNEAETTKAKTVQHKPKETPNPKDLTTVFVRDQPAKAASHHTQKTDDPKKSEPSKEPGNTQTGHKV